MEVAFVQIDAEAVAKKFRESGMLISPDAVEMLVGKSNDEINAIVERLKTKEISFIDSISLREAIEVKVPDFIEIKRPSDFKPIAKEVGHNFEINMNKDITGRSKCSGKIEDFVKYFNDRFQKIKEIITARPSKNRILTIESIGRVEKGGEARVVGMISRKTTSKKGHLILEIEDETDSTIVLVLNDNKSRAGMECFQKASRLVEDEVVAVDLKIGQNYNIAIDVIWPDLPLKNKVTIDKDISIAFISDTHVGSKFFHAKEFEKMLKWLGGAGEEKEVAEKIGYLVVAGDVADGIGIFPKQEKELLIKDVYEQYRIFDEMLELVPDHIEVIVIPGDHDAVRRAEPQPSLKEFIHSPINLVGNPAYADIEGLKTLIYHGRSLISMIKKLNIPFTQPEEAAVELLRRRNLSPVYDESDIAPEHSDYLFIDEIDIFALGHMHRNSYTEYRGCVVVGAGTWQAKTEFQLKMGLVPTPCILPVYNLKEGRITHVNFIHDTVI